MYYKKSKLKTICLFLNGRYLNGRHLSLFTILIFYKSRGVDRAYIENGKYSGLVLFFDI